MTRWDDAIASRAMRSVDEVTDAQFAKYRSRVAELATMVQLSGVAATLAFLAGRDDPSHALAGEHLARELGPLVERAGPDATPGNVARDTLALDTDARVVLERHARVFAGWMKRTVEIRQRRTRPAVAES